MIDILRAAEHVLARSPGQFFGLTWRCKRRTVPGRWRYEQLIPLARQGLIAFGRKRRFARLTEAGLHYLRSQS